MSRKSIISSRRRGSDAVDLPRRFDRYDRDRHDRYQSISDAGEILATNGPFGPGELAKPQAVIASADMVAIDSYSVRYLEMKHDAVTAFGMAAKHGLGTADLGSAGVREVILG